MIKNIRKPTAGADLPLYFQPGEKMEYCNRGYFLLGLIIEQVSGKDYKDFIQEKILSPLHMDATTLTDFQKIIPNRAAGYGQEIIN